MIADSRKKPLSRRLIAVHTETESENLFKLEILKLVGENCNHEESVKILNELSNISSYFPSKIGTEKPQRLSSNSKKEKSKSPEKVLIPGEGSGNISFKKSLDSPHVNRLQLGLPSDTVFDYYSFQYDKLALSVEDNIFIDEMIYSVASGLMLSLLAEISSSGIDFAFEFIKRISEDSLIVAKSNRKNFLAKKIIEGSLTKENYKKIVLRNSKAIILKTYNQIATYAEKSFESLVNSLNHQLGQELKHQRNGKGVTIRLLGELGKMFCLGNELPVMLLLMDKQDVVPFSTFDSDKELKNRVLLKVAIVNDATAGWWVGFGVRPMKERIRFLTQRKIEGKHAETQANVTNPIYQSPIQASIIPARPSERSNQISGLLGNKSLSTVLKNTHLRKIAKESIQSFRNSYERSAEDSLVNPLTLSPNRLSFTLTEEKPNPFDEQEQKESELPFLNFNDININPNVKEQIAIIPEKCSKKLEIQHYRVPKQSSKTLLLSNSESIKYLASVSSDPDILSIINKYRDLEKPIPPKEIETTTRKEITSLRTRKTEMLKKVYGFVELMENNSRGLGFQYKQSPLSPESISPSLKASRNVGEFKLLPNLDFSTISHKHESESRTPRSYRQEVLNTWSPQKDGLPRDTSLRHTIYEHSFNPYSNPGKEAKYSYYGDGAKVDYNLSSNFRRSGNIHDQRSGFINDPYGPIRQSSSNFSRGFLGSSAYDIGEGTSQDKNFRDMLRPYAASSSEVPLKLNYSYGGSHDQPLSSSFVGTGSLGVANTRSALRLLPSSTLGTTSYSGSVSQSPKHWSSSEINFSNYKY